MEEKLSRDVQDHSHHESRVTSHESWPSDVRPATRDARLLPWAGVFGIGLVPVLPGTIASAAAAGLYLAGAFFLPPEAVGIFCLSTAVLFAAVTLGEGHRLSRDREDPDPSVVVSDEMAGALVAFGGLWDLHLEHGALVLAVIAFLLFRLFDILKPFGIRQLEKIPGGLGILIDDLAAGILACLGTRAILWAGTLAQ